MENQFINVHIFDSQLKNKFKPKNILNSNEKKKLFTETLLPLLKNPIAKNNLNHIIEGNSTYQIDNDMDATDILTDILLDPNWLSLLEILEEQLVDMRLGLCPAGKCCRLFQVWTALN
jgi:hypothetical protein